MSLSEADLVAFAPSTDLARSRALYEGVLDWLVPDIAAGARIAWFEDPDGNVLSLTQRGG